MITTLAEALRWVDRMAKTDDFWMYKTCAKEDAYGLYYWKYCVDYVSFDVGTQLISAGIAIPVVSEDPQWPKWKLVAAAVTV